MNTEIVHTEEKKKRKKKKKKRGGIINTIMGGSLFANEFVRRNAALIALIVFYSFIYVSLHQKAGRQNWRRFSRTGKARLRQPADPCIQ